VYGVMVSKTRHAVDSIRLIAQVRWNQGLEAIWECLRFIDRRVPRTQYELQVTRTSMFVFHC